MRLNELIDKVDKRGTLIDFNINRLAEHLGLYTSIYDSDLAGSLTCYYLASWVSHDTEVGIRVYFMNDDFVMVSMQSERYSEEEYEWVSLESAVVVKKYIQSLDNEIPNVKLCNLDNEMDEGYELDDIRNVMFDDLTNSNLKLKGEKVKILDLNDEFESDKSKVKIETMNGEIKEVKVKDLTFGYYITR